MDQLIHADVFFFITAVATIILTALLTVILVYGIKISRDLRRIIRLVREQTELVSADLSELRSNIRREGLNLKNLWHFFQPLLSWAKVGKVMKSKKKNNEEKHR